jgi:insertion element IS1 protein InsB
MPPPQPVRRHPRLELDELWTFVGHKQPKRWIWLAVDRDTRQVVAWVLGDRSRASAKRLWKALPRFYQRKARFYTDEWKAYCGVLPRKRHRRCRKGSGKTNVVEGVNNFLRQRCGALTRKTCAFSRSLVCHENRIKLLIHEFNITRH